MLAHKAEMALRRKAETLLIVLPVAAVYTAALVYVYKGWFAVSYVHQGYVVHPASGLKWAVFATAVSIILLLLNDARPRYSDDDYDEPLQPLRRGPSPAARRPIEQPGAPLDVEPMPRPDNRGEGRPQRDAEDLDDPW